MCVCVCVLDLTRYGLERMVGYGYVKIRLHVVDPVSVLGSTGTLLAFMPLNWVLLTLPQVCSLLQTSTNTNPLTNPLFPLSPIIYHHRQ